jgi:hypothetical protein
LNGSIELRKRIAKAVFGERGFEADVLVQNRSCEACVLCLLICFVCEQ